MGAYHAGTTKEVSKRARSCAILLILVLRLAAPTIRGPVMSLTFTPLHETFAAEVNESLTLATLDDAATLADIRAGMDRFGVLVFRDQAFANDEQLAFA